MGKQKSKIEILYEVVSKDYDIGSLQEFESKLQDENKRKVLFDAIGKDYDLGTFEDFTSKVKKKDFSTQGSASGFAPSQGIKPGTSVFPQQQFSVEEQAKPMPVEKRYKKEEEPSYLSQVGSALERGANEFNKGLAAIPATAYDFAGAPFRKIGLGVPTSSELADRGNMVFGAINTYIQNEGARQDQLTKDAQIDSEVQKGIVENVKNGNYSNAFQSLGLGIAESLPAMIGMGLTGGAVGTSAKVATMGGMLRNEAVKQTAMAAPFISNKWKEIADDPTMSEEAKILNALGTGYAETFFEDKFGTLGLLKQARKILAEQGEQAARDYVKKGFAETMKSGFSKYFPLTAPITNAIEEGSTKWTQNATDILTGKSPDLDPLEGVGEAMAQGAGFGLGIGAGTSILKYAKDKKLQRAVATSKKPEVVQAVVNKLDEQLANGTITPEEHKEAIDTMDKAEKVDATIPQDLSGEARLEANELITMRNDLDDAITFISEEREATDPAFRASYDGKIESEESKKAVINDAIVGLTAPVIYRKVEGGFQKESNGKTEDITEAQFNFAKDNGFTGIKIEGVSEKAKGNKIKVYHAGTLDGNEDANIYTTRDRKIAEEYSKMNKSDIQEIEVVESEVVDEQEVRSIINELGITDKQGNKYGEDLFLHEIIDDRFDTGMSKENSKKLKDELKARGYKAVSFNDEDITQNNSFGVESILLLENPTKAEQGSAVTEEGGAVDVEAIDNRLADIETELQDPDITEERIQELNTEKDQLNATKESDQQVIQGGEQGNQLQREGTQEGQPQAGQGKGSQGQTTQPEADNRDSNIEGEGENITGKKRGFVESAQNAPTTESIADALENNPESFYTPVSIDEGKSVVDAMTEDQKKSVIDKVVDFFDSIKGDNIAVLAGIDLINEYMAKGDVKSAEAIVEKLASVGTAAGRLIQQFATLQSSNPVSFTFALDKVLDKYGIELTDAQRKSLQELFINQKETSDNLQTAIDKYAEDLSKESYAEMMQAMEVNRKAIDAMTKKLGRILPKSVFETLGMAMQGNMLVLKSLLSNPVYNALFVPIRLTKKEVANLVDSFFTKFIFTDSGRVLSSGVNKDNIKYSIPAAWDGIIKAWNKTWRGSVSETDLSRIEMNRSLNPIEAAKQIRMQVTELWYDTLKKEYEAQEKIAKKKGQKFDGERFVANLIEAVPGTPANIMLRLLAFGDDPFFEPARVSELVGIGQRKGLSGDALKSFIINPDKESAQAAIDVAKEAVFQQDNNISDLVNFFNKTIDTYFKDFPMIADMANFFLIKTMLPFVKTPSNVFSEILKYAVPIIPAAKFSYAIAKTLKNEKLMNNATTEAQKNKYKKEFDKSRRDFAEGFSEFAISMALWSVGMALSSAGLIEGEEEEENKKNPKLKAYSYATKGGPLSLNIDGAIRLFSFQDPSPRPTDRKIALASLGIQGASFYITHQATKDAPAKSSQYDFETGKQLEGKPNYKGEYFKNILSTLPASGQFMLNQSFTQGAGALATALETNEWDKFLLQISKAGTTAFLPNSIDNFNRVNREFMKVPYGETFSENYINFLKMKFGKDDDLPIRRGLFGEKITQNPKGANPTVYQFFDIFKTADMYQMPIYFKLDVLLNQSKKQLGDPDLKLIPDIPDRTIVYNGKTYPLKPKWHELLQKEVGDARLPLVMEILGNNETYSEDLASRLDAAYKLGSDTGTQEFLSKYGQKLNEN